jgi:hypothetical protein
VGTKKGTNTKAQKEATEARAIAETEEALQRDAELREYWLGGAELLKRAADAVVTFHMLEPSTGEG